ncbi:hypothetical protein B0H63DRAFT_474912 [Podospora didyma]|uniref:Nucleotide-diphospho-sugar transferase domain-containing protein n=1 Tax=Podospora didyma TaxID=330526 RepID=A0AAE0TVH2_9PEZI|nr:hypothetical protein B0H63DRAFT_474912 [Podospora didyma]
MSVMSAFPNVPQQWRRLIVLLPIAVVTLALLTGLYNGALPKPKLPTVSFSDPKNHFNQECKAKNELEPLDGLADAIRALWQPLVVPINASSFTTLDGAVKELPPQSELTHLEKLGKRIVILDVDTRPLTEDGSIFSENLPTWDNLRNPSAGFISHYMYSLIHGYSYKFVRSPVYRDRAPHWTKVIFTKQLLEEFDYVIMLDYDAMFPSPELPLEWMFNYWKIDKKVMVAMAEDPNGGVNMDIKGRVNLNSGFIIAQSSPNTKRLFKDWAECPSENKYKDCAQWKMKLFHEQAAFSSHVRYNFLDGYSIDTHPEYIRVLPCSEANGIPKVKHLGCWGQLVRHYWGDKSKTNLEFQNEVMSALVPMLAKSAYRDPEIVQDYRAKFLDGGDIVDTEPALPPPPPEPPAAPPAAPATPPANTEE